MCYTNQEKPIEELILNTKELDFAKSYREKQMKIVEAVNGMKAENAPVCAVTVWIDHFGSYCFGLYDTNKSVCTIAEYNQCIEEMKYHYDIPKWCSYNRADKEPLTVENSDQSFYEKEKFVYGQDVYVDDFYKNIEFMFGCYHPRGDKATVFSYSHSIYNFELTRISSKPIKSKKDIELEEAKKKQLHDNSFIYSHYFKSIDSAREMFLDMQEDGRLAEIILPLEES